MKTAKLPAVTTLLREVGLASRISIVLCFRSQKSRVAYFLSRLKEFIRRKTEKKLVALIGCRAFYFYAVALLEKSELVLKKATLASSS